MIETKMSKRNIAYIKPEDPKFLRLLKQQVGYDNHNPKFARETEVEDEEPAIVEFMEDGDNEQPQVVVLGPGDLTADEGSIAKLKFETDALNTKADLNQRVIFSSLKKKANTNTPTENILKCDERPAIKKKRKTKPLSFNIEDDE